MINDALKESANNFIKSGKVAISNGNMENALRFILNGLDLDRKHVEGCRLAAEIYFQRQDFFHAEKYAKRAIKEPKETTDRVWQILSHAQSQNGNDEDAEANLLNGVWYFPDSASLRLMLGNYHQAKQEFAAAGVHYINALNMQNLDQGLRAQLTQFCQNLYQQLAGFMNQQYAQQVMKQFQDQDFENAKLGLERLCFLNNNGPMFLRHLGVCYYKLDDYARGAILLYEAKQKQPDDRELSISLAHCLRNWEKNEEALELLDTIQDLAAKYKQIEFATADIMVRLEKYDGAREIVEPKLKDAPDDLRYIKRMVRLLAYDKKYDQAIEYVPKMVELDPEKESTHTLAAMIYEGLEDPEKAGEHYQKSIDLNPENKQNWIGYASLLAENLELEKAQELFQKAQELDVDSDMVAYSIGTIKLFNGKYPEGWDGYEKRDHINQEIIRTDKPEWKGEDLTGKKLLVIFEQGIGDLVQFIRVLKLVKNYNVEKLIISVPNQAVELLKTFDGYDEILPFSTYSLNQTPHDYYIPLMSIPHVVQYKPNMEKIDFPYLNVSDEKIDHWKKRVEEIYQENKDSKEENPLRVGIFWQGNPNYKLDHRRSVHLKEWESVIKRDDALFYSLQKFEGRDQFKEVDFADRIIDMDEELDTDVQIFLDTVAALKNLDLLITTDSGICHIAGAVGIKTWLILGKVPDWRWGPEGTECVWYPNTRLFRQKEKNVWSDVFENINVELDKLREKQLQSV